MQDCLVIADVHGHLDRLIELLLQEGIIDKDEKRINHDVEVIQIGDLGHFGGNSGSPTGDHLCYCAAVEGLIDLLLWGNHDRAVFDIHHGFAGYQHPDPRTVGQMEKLISEGRYVFAAARHGYFLSHAGLPSFRSDLFQGLSPEELAERFNDPAIEGEWEVLRDAIGRSRGGMNPYGGILWKDWEEFRYGGPSICGHTARPGMVRRDESQNWCIDIGAKEGHSLAALWLREGDPELVWVGPEPIIWDEDDPEMTFNALPSAIRAAYFSQ